MKYQPKPRFIERMKLLLKNKQDLENYLNIIKKPPLKSIRCNLLKINPNQLKKRLENYGWKIIQPYTKYPEIMQIQSNLKPGESGKTKENLLGYYYIQEITSMMPVIALNINQNDIFLDLCAAPGSKTTQAAEKMQNKGTIIANDVSIPRISILSSNLEKQGITNTIITRHDGLQLISKLKKINMKFDKILVDAPCSGEGNIRISPKTLLEWSENLLKKMQKRQIKLLLYSISLLKPQGEIVYSTCTHSPEENEIVINEVLKKYPDLKIQEIKLPLKTRQGIISWNNQKLNPDLKHAIRIYPHDENLEGFFICKLKK